ncbi:hypothetical protein BDR26DRAFT_891964 [Obelidium mucronatum]|nr:hypothetical protein BDR26DRAFT_891964 [Obelidium mucronatum]
MSLPLVIAPFILKNARLQIMSLPLVIAPFILKNARLCIIYASRTIIKKERLKDQRWLSFVAFVVAGEIILLTFWTGFAELKIMSEVLSENKIQYICKEGNGIPGYLLWSYNGCLLGALLAVTYAARNMDARHSEFSFLLIVSVSVVIAGGLVIFLKDSPVNSDVVRMYGGPYEPAKFQKHKKTTDQSETDQSETDQSENSQKKHEMQLPSIQPTTTTTHHLQSQ